MTTTDVAARALCGAALLPLLAGCGAPLHGSDAAAHVASTATPAPTPPPRQMYAMATADSSCAAATSVPISPGRAPDTKLPGYGFGPGPAYLTGQVVAGKAVWYASGQEADFVVDPGYTEGILVHGDQIDGHGTVSFGGSDKIAVKEQPKQSYWRYWEGTLSFSAPGCYEILMTGNVLHERIVVQAAAGSPPPG